MHENHENGVIETMKVFFIGINPGGFSILMLLNSALGGF